MERKLAAVTNANEAMKYFESGSDIVRFDVVGQPREFVGHKAIHDLKAVVGMTGTNKIPERLEGPRT